MQQDIQEVSFVDLIQQRIYEFAVEILATVSQCGQSDDLGRFFISSPEIDLVNGGVFILNKLVQHRQDRCGGAKFLTLWIQYLERSLRASSRAFNRSMYKVRPVRKMRCMERMRS